MKNFNIVPVGNITIILETLIFGIFRWTQGRSQHLRFVGAKLKKKKIE
jgi:hypothetical protein